MTSPAWVQDLFKERSLWETFRESQRFPTSSFNTKFRHRIYPLIAVVVVCISWNFVDAVSSNKGIDAASAALLSVSATIIGFLVAGLAIFTTLSDKRILATLAQTPQAGTEVSSFKYLYFNLMNIFVVYIAILIVSAAIQVLSKMSISISDIDVAGITFTSAIIVNGLVLAGLVIIFAEGMICLKTFIWNIYATFISVLTVSALLETEGAPGTDTSGSE